MKTVAEVGEKEIISNIIRPLFASHEQPVRVGLGDDAAVIDFPPGSSLVATIDKIPEKLISHELGLIGFYEVGYYLIVTQLSDLAAMGATPVGILVSICVPDKFLIEDLVDLFQGIKKASETFNVPVIGGILREALRTLLLLLGLYVPPTHILRRNAARVGQAVCVTGVPGKFGTALAYFLSIEKYGHFLSQEEEALLASAFRQPTPRIEVGNTLQLIGLQGACQDISDGVGQTAIEIAAESHLGIELRSEQLLAAGPKCVDIVAQKLNNSPSNILLGPGADFELMFTIDHHALDNVRESLLSFGVPINIVGRTVNDHGVWLVEEGQRTRIESPGFQHLTGKTDADLVRSKYQQ